MRAVDMNPSIYKIAVGESNGDGQLYVSTDKAQTFSLLPNSPVGAYRKVVMSDSGVVMYAHVALNPSPVHYSADDGASWASVGALNSTVNDIVCTPDGGLLLLFTSDYVYNFNLTTGILARESGPISNAAGNFVSGAVNADGRRRIAWGPNLWLYQGTW